MMRTYKDIRVHAEAEPPQDRQHLHRAGRRSVSVLVPENLSDRQVEDLAGKQAEMDLPEPRRMA